jgi:MFS family permease
MKASRTRHRIVLLAIGLAVLSYVQRVAISQAAGPIARDLRFSKEQMGLVFGAFGLSYALFEIPAGLLGDRLGVKRVLTQIVLAWSVCTALTGAAWNVTSLVVIRFLFGAGEAGCFPNLARMLSVWLPARERATAYSLMWAFARWGGAVAPPLALLCIDWFGWRWAFVSFAALGFVWCFIFLIWFKDDPTQHPAVNDAERNMLEASRVLTTHQAGDRHWIFRLMTWGAAALGLQYFCFSYVWTFYITWLPTYLHEGRGQPLARTATLSVLPLLFGGFGSLFVGIAPRTLPRRAIAMCGFLATAISLFAITHIRSVVPAMLIMGLASFSSDLALPISWDACVEIGGPYTATVGAAMNSTGNLAGFVAPLVGGLILQRTGGNWNVLIDTMAAAAVVSAACWLFLGPDSARRQRELEVADAGINPTTDGLTP